MTKDEALDLVLKALGWTDESRPEGLAEKAITAIKQARSAPVQEPEHIVHSNGRYSPLLTHMMNKRVESNVKQVIHLYDEPPAAPVQEPVGYIAENGVVDWNVCAPPILTDLYTTPPAAQRQWVGLTDEEILAANYPDGEENGPTISAPNFELDCFAKQVEAKLKEKNSD